MKKMIVCQLLGLVLIGAYLTGIYGCKAMKMPLQSLADDSTSVTETSIRDLILRDTIPIPADTSAWMQMLIECDSEGNAHVAEAYSQLGERSRILMKEYFQQDSIISRQDSLLKTKKRLVLRTTCQCDSGAIYAEFHLRDTTVNKYTEVVKKVPVPVPMELTWWEKFKIAYGGYAFGVIALVLLYYFGRFAVWALSTFTPQGAAIKAGTGIMSTVFKLFR